MRRAIRRSGGLAAGVAAILVTARPPDRPTSQWLPDERVLISDHSVIDAVAASPWLVFAATRHGLALYDRAAHRWRAPVTALDGYPAQRVRSAAADPAGNAVWLSLAGGGWTRYDADARRWTPGGDPPREALASVMTVEQALARAPAADALRALILTDPRLRSYRFTAAAGTPDRPELFFGTNGMGLVQVDPLTGEWQILSYGLVAPGVGALALTGDGVWAAARTRAGERRGLTWVAADLSETRPAEGGGAALGFAFQTPRRMIPAEGALWLATERGVLRINTRMMRVREFGMIDATSLAPGSDGMWAGTPQGLVVITRDEIPRAGPADLPVLSLLAVGESLWVGTPSGVGLLAPGASVLAHTGSPSLPVLALARVRDTIVGITDRGLLWRDAAGEWRERPLTLALGRPTTLVADFDRGVWVGGTQGLAHLDLPTALARALTVPVDVPAAVRDVAVEPDYLWVATDSGLVRFDRRAALRR